MSSHTLDPIENTDVRPSETGWARARRLREEPVMRTCVPAVEDPGAVTVTQPGVEGNIVRGED
ncbi:hypothetical protein ACFV0T_40385 [Streptomyces sp. NPDC059582]|uniref:hypothetical protein n=1 Tax=Streptomyces sp. NPDC059582 TaxID=3346875 RepID=UPI00369BEAE5